MTRQNITIESTTKPTNPKQGIKFNGEWHTVIGNAAKYVKNLKPGPATIDMDEEGNIIFAQQERGSQNQNQNQEQAKEESSPHYLEGGKPLTVSHLVFSNLSDEELRLALNNACEQYGSPLNYGDKGVFASQTHFVDGKWSVVIFIRE